MEALKNWIIGITAASIIVSSVIAIAPDTGARKILKFIGGLIMLIVVLGSLQSFVMPDFSAYSSIYQAEYEGYADSLSDENEKLIKAIIEERTRTYILEKAEDIGITCDVEITSELRDGVPFPYTVQYICEHEPPTGDRDKLETYVLSELGIEVENQKWVVRNEE